MEKLREIPGTLDLAVAADSPQLALSLTFLLLLRIVLIAIVLFAWQDTPKVRCSTSAYPAGRLTAEGDPLRSTSLKDEYKEFISFLFAELKYHRLRQSDRYEYLKACMSVSKNLYIYLDRIEKLAQTKAFIQGWKEGMESGRKTWWEEGYLKGLVAGQAKGNRSNYRKGRKEGLKNGEEDGYKEGYNEGYSEGHAEGHADGYTIGYRRGRRKMRKEKTSV